MFPLCSLAIGRHAMDEADYRNLALGAAYRLAFDDYLRTGVSPTGLCEDVGPIHEMKYNHNHDSSDGRFTFSAGGGGGARANAGGRADAGGRGRGRGHSARHKLAHRSTSANSSQAVRKARFYTGMTAHGEHLIRPISGGHVDPSGHYVTEMFPPDPYHLSNPVSALAHYVGGSGEARNFYLNTVDTSNLSIEDFH